MSDRATGYITQAALPGVAIAVLAATAWTTFAQPPAATPPDANPPPATTAPATTVPAPDPAAPDPAAPESYKSPYSAYDGGAYEQALQGFVDQQVEHPENPDVALHLGRVPYAMKN